MKHTTPLLLAVILSLPAWAQNSANDKVRLTRTTRANTTSVAAQNAWSQLAAGELAQAAAEYQTLLKTDPRNADALQGLAHVAAREGRFLEARQLLSRALEADPRDGQVYANLIALEAGADPLAAESQLKLLLGKEPALAAGHFAYGAVLARQSRWAEAQQALSRAVMLEPDNPDYHYNLAVSLDHTRQPAAALEHYRAALQAATRRLSGFDHALATERINALSTRAP